MPADEAVFHVLFEGINNRLEYLVARVDDVYDRVDALGKAMQTIEQRSSQQVQAIEAIAVAKSDCAHCQQQWVPRRWAKPVIAACGSAILLAGIAGDWVDALAKMGWRP